MPLRSVEEINRYLSRLDPGTIGAAVLALPDDERTELTRSILPTHDELQQYIDAVSDPTSPSYDPDLAN